MGIFNFFRKKALLKEVTQTDINSALMQVGFNKGVTLYPVNDGNSHIRDGYNKSVAVYSIVSKCAKKFSQVPWYHYRINRNEQKTWNEYIALTKDSLHDVKAVIEAKKMRTKAVEQVKVDSDLQKFLNKPNRNQSGAQFREQLYGYKLLTGEGNTWMTRLQPRDRPQEMLIIPKTNLALVRGMDPWDIESYVLKFGGVHIPAVKDDVLMWKFPNYMFDALTLLHLRGQSPLDAGLLAMQASNEAEERRIAMNKNQGVAGLAFNEQAANPPTPAQAMFQRQQFNSIINDKDLAGSIAVMNGKWGYIQFGLNAGQLQLLEQTEASFQSLCNIFDVPAGIFAKDQTYENRKEQKREFVYDNIAVAAYGLRDEWNAKLVPEFNLDRERDVIDCDILSLPELSEDLKTQAETLKNLWQLTPNQVLEYIGYDKSKDPNMDKVYVPTTLQPLDQLNSDLGGSLDAEQQLLNQ